MVTDSTASRIEINPLIYKDLASLKYTPTPSCTIFTVEDGTSIFFGNNEDEGGSRENTSIWFQQSTDEAFYGCAFVGFTNNPPGRTNIDGLPIGGLNTQGLCFDANGLNVEYVDPEPEKSIAQYSSMGYWEYILRECATVDEVIQWYQTRNLGGYWYNQIHWADSSGDAVVISPVNGQVVYTRKNNSYLVSTNFNLANPTYDYPCERYTTVFTMLDDIIQDDNLSIDSIKEVLDEVHLAKNPNYIGTVYSNIFDLKEKEIYLYIRANFNEVIKFNLAEELAKGTHEYDMISLPIISQTTNTFAGFIVLIELFVLSIICRKTSH
jgi:penicillin V acylase-like amidase (Ntn superfamily)